MKRIFLLWLRFICCKIFVAAKMFHIKKSRQNRQDSALRATFISILKIQKGLSEFACRTNKKIANTKSFIRKLRVDRNDNKIIYLWIRFDVSMREYAFALIWNFLLANKVVYFSATILIFWIVFSGNVCNVCQFVQKHNSVMVRQFLIRFLSKNGILWRMNISSSKWAERSGNLFRFAELIPQNRNRLCTYLKI